MKKICIYWALGFLALNATAQDPLFTQFYHTPLYTNPAFCGTGKNEWRLAGALRLQWTRIPSAMRTASVSAEKQIRNIRGGFGLMLNHNNEGYLKTNSIQAIYCQEVNLSEKSSIYLGIQLGKVWRNFDLTDFLFADQIDQFGPDFYRPSGVEAVPSGGNHFTELGSGIILTYGNFMVGGAIHHWYNTDQGLFGDQYRLLNRRVTGHLNYLIDIDPDDQNSVKIKPAVIFNMQGSSKSVLAGTQLYLPGWDSELGIWYQNNLDSKNSHRLSIGINFKLGEVKNNYNNDARKHTRAGISADRELANGLPRRTFGSFEVGAVHEVNSDEDCPHPYDGRNLKKYPWAFL